MGANRVLGNVGVGGFPAFISIQHQFWWPVYLPITIAALVIPAILTVFLAKFSHEKTKKIVTPPEAEK